MKMPLRGSALLGNSLHNKGTAFTRQEREALGLEGLLPHRVSPLEDQVRRAHANIVRKEDPLERYIGLVSLQDRNEVLFYRLLHDHIEELLPVVYTPTVGLACQRYSEIFRRPRGIWITPAHRGNIAHILESVPADIELIVVTDNERILGLGDQGAGGMGIPVGKLALYSVAAGIDPSRTLPISLDVGTDNQELLADELYLGYPEPRLRGEAYDELVEEFVTAVQARFPQVLLQWEDFKKGNAFALLDRYQKRLPSFNDDIQGTAATAVAGVLAAVRATGRPLTEQRVVMLGAGAAGVGIMRQIKEAFRRAGVTGDDLQGRMGVLDSRGLLLEERGVTEPHKKEFAWSTAVAQSFGLTPENAGDLESVVTALKPTVLIGTSGQPGAFTQSVIRTMAAHAERPVIFPLSNPTSKSEANPAHLVKWTEGRALMATGSPFDPVEYEGRRIETRQGNNVYVFPGIGLGALVSRASEVTDSMMTAAAEALASLVTEDDLAVGALFPSLTRLREVSLAVAVAVVREAMEAGVARHVPEGDVEEEVARAMWSPVYPEYDPS